MFDFEAVNSDDKFFTTKLAITNTFLIKLLEHVENIQFI